MGLDIYGNIIYRNQYSKCRVCKYYIEGYKCEKFDYIHVMMWNGSENEMFICPHRTSTIRNQCNAYYVHRDYENEELFPEKDYSQGKYKFDFKGNIIGKNK